MKIGLEWKPQDLWIGVFWDDRTEQSGFHPDYRPEGRVRHVWVCLLPMLPIHLSWPLT